MRHNLHFNEKEINCSKNSNCFKHNLILLYEVLQQNQCASSVIIIEQVDSAPNKNSKPFIDTMRTI